MSLKKKQESLPYTLSKNTTMSFSKDIKYCTPLKEDTRNNSFHASTLYNTNTYNSEKSCLSENNEKSEKIINNKRKINIVNEFIDIDKLEKDRENFSTKRKQTKEYSSNKNINADNKEKSESEVKSNKFNKETEKAEDNEHIDDNDDNNDIDKNNNNNNNNSPNKNRNDQNNIYFLDSRSENQHGNYDIKVLLTKTSINDIAISIINSILEVMELHKEEINSTHENSVFYSKKIPSIPLDKYLERIIKYSNLENSTLIYASMLVDKFCFKQNFFLCENSIYR